MTQASLTKGTASAAPVDPRNGEALADLVEAVAQRRDKEAFARLFRTIAPRIKAYALNSGFGQSEAETLARETMLALWHRAPAFRRAEASVMSWVFTLLRERLPESRQAGTDSQSAEAPAAHSLPQRLGRLPADQALLLHKALVEHKSHSALAAELDVPLRTVQHRIRQALVGLRAARAAPSPMVH